MLQFFTKRLQDKERGFTLIELMVVVLIIAILIAIAIPTFLGARKRAQDRAAQSSLRNGLTAAKTIFTDNESYHKASATALAASEPSLTFDDSAGTSDGPNNIVVLRPTAGEVTTGTTISVFEAVVYSKSGQCFGIKDTAGPTATVAGLGTTYAKEAAVGTTCGNVFVDADYTSTGWN